MTEPLILLDIDGVINTDGFHSEEFWTDMVKVRSISKFCYSPSMITKINDWSAIAEVKWLTDWNERANSIIAPLVGLQLFSLGRNENANTAKIEAFLTNAARDSNRLVIWIDDELKSFKEQSERCINSNYNSYLRYHNGIFTRPNTVLVSPAIGLSETYARQIDAILENPEQVKDQCIHMFEDGERLYVRR